MSHQSRIFQHINNDPILDIVEGSRSDLTNLETEGVSQTMTNSIEKCLWNEDAVFSYSVNSNVLMFITSDNANDTNSSGTGARTVKISGLVHSVVSSKNIFTEFTETKALFGTAVVSCSSFYRVLKLEVLTAGNLGVNQGNIKVYNSATNHIFSCMAAGDNVSNQLVVAPPTNQNIIVESLNVTAYHQTPTELKINVYSQSTNLQKTIYKFLLGSPTVNFNFKVRKLLVAGDTLWASLNPLETITGQHHRISALLECSQKHTNSVIPSRI